MKCPNNHELAQRIKIGTVKIDRCSECRGLWFNRDELRLAKDSQEEETRWFDIDLWKNEKDFKSASSHKFCPVCQAPFYNIQYGNSGICVEVCKNCLGLWLEEGEFRKIVDFVQKESAYTLLNNYIRSLIKEGKEIFTGPEDLKSEIGDFLMVLKLLQFKLASGHPALTRVLTSLPFTK